ncbi:DUF2239 family protein [Chromobacterium paludis]|uniref:DUF2239 family protein n=1 Tax=Chromobacterium paludis TaxID=2605945 RepID=A0A5C1DJM8_9NEIS|nr:DUF2239 family protein [Chromobacterium paludis]
MRNGRRLPSRSLRFRRLPRCFFLRAAPAAAYPFMTAPAGDVPAYEEARRALFADDGEQLMRHMASWPADIR